MTGEEKELLLKDLCARLPYDVVINCIDEDCNFTCYLTTAIFTDIQSNNPHYEYKPYLLPLSSMTEEQEKELEKIDPEFYSMIDENGNVCVSMNISGYDWLLKNYFDFRGLIPMGLAIDATGLNIY